VPEELRTRRDFDLSSAPGKWLRQRVSGAALRILLITFDVIGPRIGGSAIRVLGLARALAEIGHLPTIAAARIEDGHPDQPFPLRPFDNASPRETLGPLLETVTCAVLPLHALARLPFLRKATVPLVFDIYDPVLFELMETTSDAAEKNNPEDLRSHVQLLNQVLRRGDFFICASERQRDFWLGALAANGRISASATPDPELRDLIAVVPFGIDPTPIAPAVAGRPNLNAAIPALAGAERIIVWPGGIWDWTDAQIITKAMRILGQRSPGIHLVLFAGTHPTEGHVETSTARKARALATEFQLNGRSVHFIDDYIPYGERGRYLAECDAAVSTHRANLESHFAYRTRLLDCIWAGLPIVCTEGDVMAEMVARHGFGIVVPAGDDEELAHALQRICTETEFVATCRTRIAESRHLFRWSDAIEPLARFCRQPRVTHVDAPIKDASMLASSAWRVFKTHGAVETVRRLRQHLRSR
jgi:glycosyltransferase involved in cell wall biosynthesis